jgi:predicted short-subunit dehydrogenase-like oxidoreductase (DUF2520 family)
MPVGQRVYTGFEISAPENFEHTRRLSCIARHPVPIPSAILPGMADKPSIAIVGAGNLAAALAMSLRGKGFHIDAIITRERAASLVRARSLAAKIGSRVLSRVEGVQARLLWICVPDTATAQAAASLANRFDGHGKVALHSSGVLSSDVLQPLRAKGASVASVHPFMTFVRGSRPSFAGVPFAIEGDSQAVRIARSIVRRLGGEPYAISKQKKNAYHAWGTFASPLLTALLAVTEQVAVLAGVPPKQARRRMVPILLQTVRNYEEFGARGGFSGPIIRGDVATLRRHLDVLRRSPVPRQVYATLARAALEYLPAKNKASLKRLLDCAGRL